MPPWIWPTTASGLIALPTSCAVSSATTFTRPSSTSTSTTARCAENANCTCASPWPVSGSIGVGGPVPPLHGLLDRVVPEHLGQAGEHLAGRPDDLLAVQPQVRGRPAERQRRPLQDGGPHGLAGRLHRAPGHVGLPGRRRRAAGADGGVLRVDDDPLDPELGAADLLLDGDQALADLGGGGVHGRDRLAAGHLQPHPRGRVVVEALGEADVLVGDGVADAADDALAVGRVVDRAGQRPQVGVVAALGRQRQVGHDLQQLADRRGGVDDLAGDVEVALAHAVAAAGSPPGPRPTASASSSISASCANAACTQPNPRIAPHGGLLVNTP